MEPKEYPLNTNYLVYADGRIYSKRFHHFITPKKNWDGYMRIQIWKDNTCHMVGWHRVIAETYCEHPEGCDVVNHKNGIKDDNRAENLEWVTQRDNIDHSVRIGLKPMKATDVYDKDGHLIGSFKSTAEACRVFGLDTGSACRVLNGKLKSTGGYVLKFSATSNDYRSASTLTIDTSVETGATREGEDIV